MFCVVDLESRAVICYADGARKTYANEAVARSYAEALQQKYPQRVFNITSALDDRINSLKKLPCVYGHALKLREDLL